MVIDMKKIVKNTRKLQAAATKEKIFIAAVELFNDYDMDNVNIEMITTRAGIAKGSFYVHFKSKNAMITELANRKVAEVDLNYERFFSSLLPDTNTSEILLLVTDRILHVMTDDIGHDYLSIMYEMLLDKSEDIRAVTSPERKLYDTLASIVTLGIQRGDFRNDLDIKQLASHLLIALRGLTYQWCVLYPNFDLHAHGKSHMQLLLKGIENTK